MKLSTLSGTLIVAGTSIGAGMLGLPVVTGTSGFFPSLVVLTICWAFMATTGLLFAELALLHKEDINILSMAQHTLGRTGKLFAWVVYLFLFYSLLVAYFVGGGNLTSDFFDGSQLSAIILFATLFIGVISLGKRVVDPLNKLCMVGLFVAYIGFVAIGAKNINTSFLLRQNWSATWTALPIAFTAFGYQGTIPTLASWMHYDRRALRTAIIGGTLITLFIYIVWQWLILGIVPVEGPHGILETVQEGRDAVHPLQFFTNSPTVWKIGRAFAFFAISTSFLGVGIALIDFWADGLGIKKRTVSKKLALLALTFAPPLFFALLYPHIFLAALSVAGGFGSALLLGLLPLLMAVQAKILKKKWLFLALIAFVVFEIGCELVQLLPIKF
ncbi:MAG: tyrP 4 [Chlamydiia bacterium]|nr:tyrP 4 [Chlamydiia bacterium]